METGPLENVDEAAASEAAAKLTEALATARDLALERDFDGAQLELKPWLLPPEDDPEAADDRIRQAGDAKAMSEAIRKAQAIHDPAGIVGLKPVREFAGELPSPVLWMDSRRGGGTIMRVGEAALLSGSGGSGKSFVSLALAVAAAAAGAADEVHGSACGLHVRAGPVVVLSYEDDPRTVAWRCGLIASSMGIRHDSAIDVLLIPDPAPLMEADHDNPGRALKAKLWTSLWRAIRSKSPSLVIVDPASAALAGVNLNDGATVRRFVRALAQEGKEGGFGILVIAHSTKAGRYGQADVGPNAVAGSGQWTDASRGVLFMQGQGPKRAVIQCVKSNHGPVGWAVELEADMRKRAPKPDRFAGWKKLQRYGPEQWAERVLKLEEARKARAKKSGRNSGSKEEPEAEIDREHQPPSAREMGAL